LNGDGCLAESLDEGCKQGLISMMSVDRVGLLNQAIGVWKDLALIGLGKVVSDHREVWDDASCTIEELRVKEGYDWYQKVKEIIDKNMQEVMVSDENIQDSGFQMNLVIEKMKETLKELSKEVNDVVGPHKDGVTRLDFVSYKEDKKDACLKDVTDDNYKEVITRLFELSKKYNVDVIARLLGWVNADGESIPAGKIDIDVLLCFYSHKEILGSNFLSKHAHSAEQFSGKKEIGLSGSINDFHNYWVCLCDYESSEIVEPFLGYIFSDDGEGGLDEVIFKGGGLIDKSLRWKQVWVNLYKQDFLDIEWDADFWNRYMFDYFKDAWDKKYASLWRNEKGVCEGLDKGIRLWMNLWLGVGESKHNDIRGFFPKNLWPVITRVSDFISYGNVLEARVIAIFLCDYSVLHGHVPSAEIGYDPSPYFYAP
jgi:hypothetical protein